MKKELKRENGTINGKPEVFVSIRNLRYVYSNEMRKHPMLMYTNKHGSNAYDWLAVLGVVPVKKDGASKRAQFIASQLEDAIKKAGWEADDDPNAETVSPELNGNDDEEPKFSAMSAMLFLLQVVNQKVDFLINKLGEKFELDESKIIKLDNSETDGVLNKPEV